MISSKEYPNWFKYLRKALHKFGIGIADASTSDGYLSLRLGNDVTSVALDLKEKAADGDCQFRTKRFNIRYLYEKDLTVEQEQIIKLLLRVLVKIEQYLPVKLELPQAGYSEQFHPSTSAPEIAEKNVKDYLPGEDVLRQRWFVQNKDITVRCYRPWVNMELSDIVAKGISACNPDWIKIPFTCLGKKPILKTWNSKYYRKIRKSLSDQLEEKICFPHCGVFNRGENEYVKEEKKYLAGASRIFLENLVLNYKEIIDGRILLDSKPTEFTFGPSTLCNYNCIMCPNVLDRKKGYLHELDDQFYDELKTLLPYLSSMCISGAGEPFISKHFTSFLLNTHWSNYPDLNISVTTNGCFLAQELVERLFDVPFKGFTISLNAATRETYRKVTGTNMFERVLANIECLNENLHRFRHKKPSIQLSFVVMKSNYHEISEFLRIVENYNCGLIFLPVEIGIKNPPSYYESLIVPENTDHFDRAAENISRLIEEYREKPVFHQYLSTLEEALGKQKLKRHSIIQSFFSFIFKDEPQC